MTNMKQKTQHDRASRNKNNLTILASKTMIHTTIFSFLLQASPSVPQHNTQVQIVFKKTVEYMHNKIQQTELIHIGFLLANHSTNTNLVAFLISSCHKSNESKIKCNKLIQHPSIKTHATEIQST